MILSQTAVLQDFREIPEILCEPSVHIYHQLWADTPVGRGIEFKNWQVMLQLYRTLVRLHLEYSVQFWSPDYQNDVEALERVQKRFTRMLLGMEGISNEERLEKLGLFSLERWRLRGGLIEVYKIMRGMDRADSQMLFPRVEKSSTRRCRFKVHGEKF